MTDHRPQVARAWNHVPSVQSYDLFAGSSAFLSPVPFLPSSQLHLLFFSLSTFLWIMSN